LDLPNYHAYEPQRKLADSGGHMSDLSILALAKLDPDPRGGCWASG
jgi:hypothetical protein